MTAWNEQLRQRRLQRGLTQEELAAELARVAWEQNRERIGVDAAMVSKWERGQKQPSSSYRRLLAALFVADPPCFDEPSDDLQRLGLEYTPSIPDTLEAVDKLGHADIKRRTFLKTALFAVAASIGPSRHWLLATLEQATFPNRKVTTDHVEAIRRTFGIFQELDVMRGGGHARK